VDSSSRSIEDTLLYHASIVTILRGLLQYTYHQPTLTMDLTVPIPRSNMEKPGLIAPDRSEQILAIGRLRTDARVEPIELTIPY
jgi:hypothetical protein